MSQLANAGSAAITHADLVHRANRCFRLFWGVSFPVSLLSGYWIAGWANRDKSSSAILGAFLASIWLLVSRTIAYSAWRPRGQAPLSVRKITLHALSSIALGVVGGIAIMIVLAIPVTVLVISRTIPFFPRI
ncbi:MAG: hypothetical protein K1X57_18965 [Gemmataceae bacterium]|nr:hypothetical protein [Gemmataceae bacterium]